MNKSVLIIEDDNRQCRALAKLLKMRGILTECVGSWADGLKCSRERQFDLAVVDVYLPDSTGLQTVERLDSLNLPIVAVTGTDDPDVVGEFERRRIPYLLKPVVVRTFVKTVLSELGQKEPTEETNRAILATRNIEPTIVAEEQNWMRRNAPVIAICITFLFSSGTVVFGWYNSGIADAKTTASEKANVTSQLDQLREADKTMANALTELAKEVRQLQNFDIDSKNDRANLHSEVGRVTSEIGAMRAEFGMAQRRFERNQVRMMLKMGVAPANGDREE